MGLNTTVVILNDDLHRIEKDKDFGWKLAEAIRAMRTTRFTTVTARHLRRTERERRTFAP